MRGIVKLHDFAQKVIAESPADAKITWAHISTTLRPLIVRVTELKFLSPKMDPKDLNAVVDKLCAEMEAGFEALRD